MGTEGATSEPGPHSLSGRRQEPRALGTQTPGLPTPHSCTCPHPLGASLAPSGPVSSRPPEAGAGAPRAPGPDTPQKTKMTLRLTTKFPGRDMAWLSLSSAVPVSSSQRGGVTRTHRLRGNRAGSNTVLMKDAALPSRPLQLAQRPGHRGPWAARGTRVWSRWSHTEPTGDPAGHAGHHARATTTKPQRKENCQQEIRNRDPDPEPHEDGEKSDRQEVKMDCPKGSDKHTFQGSRRTSDAKTGCKMCVRDAVSLCLALTVLTRFNLHITASAKKYFRSFPLRKKN